MCSGSSLPSCGALGASVERSTQLSDRIWQLAPATDLWGIQRLCLVEPDGMLNCIQ